MGLLEKSLRLSSSFKASTPGLLRALLQLEQRGETALLERVKIELPAELREELRRRNLW
jgi:hypothetical protein